MKLGTRQSASRAGAAALLAVATLGAAAYGQTRAGVEDPALEKVLMEVRGQFAVSDFAEHMLMPSRENEKDAYAYIDLFEQLYNQNQRGLALRLLAAAAPVVTENPEMLSEARRRLARYEFDAAWLEDSYRAELNAAMMRKDKYLPDSVLQDRVIADRVLPAYIGKLETEGHNKPLYDLLRRAYTGRPEGVAASRAQLKDTPDDPGVIGDFLYACKSAKQFEALLDEAGLPNGMAGRIEYLQARAEALVEFKRVKEALGLMAEIEAKFPGEQWPRWQQLAELYLQVGEKEKAAKVTLQYGRRQSADAAEILAAAGDRAGVAACTRDALASELAGAWAMRCAEACWKVGEDELAEKAFDVAEERILKNIAKDPNPFFNFPGDVHAAYVRRGREGRLLEKMLPIAAKSDDALSQLLQSWDAPYQMKDARAWLLPVYKKNAAEYGQRWPFAYAYGRALESSGDYRAALEQYTVAAKVIGSLEKKPIRDEEGKVNDGQFWCYVALKDQTGLSHWVSGNASLERYRRLYVQEVDNRARAVEPSVPPVTNAALPPATTSVAAKAPVIPPVMASSEPARPELPKLLAAQQAEVVRLPKDGHARGKLAGLLLEAGKIEEGRAEMRRAAALGGVYLREPFHVLPTCLVVLGDELRSWQAVELYAKAGVLDRLEEDLSPEIKRSKGDEYAFLWRLADHYAKNGDTTTAAKLHVRMEQLDPWHEAGVF